MSLSNRGQTPVEITDREPVVRHAYDGCGFDARAIVEAFSTPPLSLDPEHREAVYEWVDIEAVDAVLDSARADVGIATVIWGHDVVITDEAIEIYDA